MIRIRFVQPEPGKPFEQKYVFGPGDAERLVARVLHYGAQGKDDEWIASKLKLRNLKDYINLYGAALNAMEKDKRAIREETGPQIVYEE